MARIQVQHGRVSDGDASRYHLVQNHLIDEKANIDKIIMYAEKRYLTTLLTSGARDSRFTAPRYTPSNRDSVSTKIKQLNDADRTPSKGYAFKVMGRIQKEVEVIGSAGTGTAGTATQGSEFSLYLGDDTLKKGMNVLFSNNKHARIMRNPTRQGTNKWLYYFQCYPGDTFSYATWVVPSNGKRTVFGGYTSYGERSKRGYSTFYYPDTYIQHTTIQRKSFSISGDANAEEVRWYAVDGVKGFVYEAEAQTRAQFLLEDEHQKWWGKSTLKDAYGNLLNRPAMIEYDDGEEIWAGDGLYEQTKGINDIETSGVNGAATYQDFADMVDNIKEHMDELGGDQIIVVTGREGMANAANIAKEEAQTNNVRYMIPAKDNKVIGGMDVQVGYNFQTLNIAGEQLLFVENPQWNDKSKYSGRLSNGKSRMGSTFFFGKWGAMNNGKNNVEIKARGRKGVDRNLVYLWKNGMTGDGKADDPIDAKSFHMLKENLIIVYDPRLFGWMTPPATA
jgi:hypothetical protein